MGYRRDHCFGRRATLTASAIAIARTGASVVRRPRRSRAAAVQPLVAPTRLQALDTARP